jgi:DNA repair exonuclease SbcCD ATPase subunit
MHAISSTVDRKFIDSVELSDLEIETDSGWQSITSIHKTVEYDVWSLKTAGGLLLECADTHIVFDDRGCEVFVKDLVPGISKIATVNGPDLVIEVTQLDRAENMFDVAVESADHRYYTNGILSHNTTIINALSYALYGQALTNIKRDNLINKTNNKNMLVSLEFSVNGQEYKVERGRKPNVLKFYINNEEQAAEDDAQGDSRETQDSIEHVLGISHDMFKHILALNTYTEPFLSLKANDQRTIIEQLLGITMLSERAERIKELNKQTKDQMQQEEFHIRAVQEANKRIEEQIESLKKRQTLWTKKRNDDCDQLTLAIEKLEKIDIDAEIQLHRDLDVYETKSKELDQIELLVKGITDNQTKNAKTLKKLQEELKDLDDHKCYACGQTVHDKKLDEIVKTKNKSIKEAQKQDSDYNTALGEYQKKLEKIGKLGRKPKVFYDTIEDALNHKNSLESLRRDLATRQNDTDPYADQIVDMQKQALQKIDYEKLNELTRLQDHQDFLLKLLTNKDSFIRKKIIEQNLSYLNNRLTHYLDRIGLPHQVIFQNDLTVEITELGRDLDFDNLSRGERNRLILSMSWAFRDVWESLYAPINVLFIDEMIDSGMDTQGVENSLALLKKMSRERNKSIWLVSHRDELAGRVENILKVVKEGGFTSYASDTETA